MADIWIRRQVVCVSVTLGSMENAVTPAGMVPCWTVVLTWLWTGASVTLVTMWRHTRMIRYVTIGGPLKDLRDQSRLESYMDEFEEINATPPEMLPKICCQNATKKHQATEPTPMEIKVLAKFSKFIFHSVRHWVASWKFFQYDVYIPGNMSGKNGWKWPYSLWTIELKSTQLWPPQKSTFCDRSVWLRHGEKYLQPAMASHWDESSGGYSIAH